MRQFLNEERAALDDTLCQQNPETDDQAEAVRLIKREIDTAIWALIMESE